MRVTVLGCGGSTGVPFIGCDCGVCRSDDPRNKRTRVSVLVEAGGSNLLIDTSPDLRQQALRENIRSLDAVLYTHDHADHLHGIDEMRSFNYLADDSIPVYGDAATLAELKQRFPYAFLPRPEGIWYRPSLTPRAIPEPLAEFEAAGVKVRPVEQRHGKHRTLGFRIGGFAYSTDCNELPDATLEALQGLEVWLVDCLRPTPSPSHAHLELTLRWIEQVKPKLAVLTHMSHDFDYDSLLNSLPKNVIPAHDGLVLECA